MKSSIFTDDGALRDEGTIRVTDMAFDEGVLLDQDRFLTAMLARPEFQRKMTGTELRYLMGRYYDDQERQNGVSRGLLSICWPCGGHPGSLWSARPVMAACF